MTTLVQNLVDGIGRGSTYALLALGISLIFGVMHLVNFAHAELITVGAYLAYFLSTRGLGWWVLAPAIVLAAVAASVGTERVAFRRVREASPFTMLLTSFAIEQMAHALWAILVSPSPQSFAGPSWVFDTVEIGGIRLEVMDLMTIAVTAVVLAATAYVFRRTLFGISVRGASEDFDAARLMGVRANRVISGAFAFAGLLAGVAAVLILMRSPSAEPSLGTDYLIKAVVAAIIGGLGSFTGAVVGGLALGVAEVVLRGYLPEGVWERMTDAFVFALIAALFVIRPQGLFTVRTRSECERASLRASERGGAVMAAVRSVMASGVLFAVLVVGAVAYTASGGAARELLVQELLINLLLVLGLQTFTGSTGILSFGHLAFAQIAAYGTALAAIPVATKASVLPDVPFGIGDVELGSAAATAVGVLVAVVVGAAVGVAVARAGGLAATMITLAVLFVVDQGVKNWQELTRGAGGLSGVPRHGTNSWLWLAVLAVLIVVNLFRETRVGRFAIATREDEIAAPAIGIDRFWPRWTAWVLSVAIVGLAGALRVQAVGSTNPTQYTLDIGVLLLAMLVVGGMRTVTGAFVGTVLLTAGNEAARQFGDRHEIPRLPQLFISLVLLAVMLVRPGGLLGDTDVAAWLRRRWRRAAPTADAAPAPVAATAGGDLVADGIVVRFGGFVALDGAGVQVGPGEFVGLIGPNGAGKTTLFNVITGLVAEQAGSVRVGEGDLSREPPHRIARAGLARTFQNLRLFPTLSVRENVELAALSARRYRRDVPAVDPDVLLTNAGLAPLAERPAATLDYGSQRRLELARAAALAPAYLLLDEPTSGMSDAESLAMVDHVRETAQLVGAGVLVIDHDLAFITRISDHVVVLAGGRLLAAGTPAAIRADPAVADAYLGRHTTTP